MMTIYPHIQSIPWDGDSLARIVDAMSLKDPYALWESAASNPELAHGDKNRFGIIAFDLEETHLVHHQTLITLRDGKEIRRNQCLNPLQASTLNSSRCDNYASALDCATRYSISLPSFIGGTFGAMSYDAGAAFENIRGAKEHEHEPTSIFHSVNTLLVLDRVDGALRHITWPNARQNVFDLNSLLQLTPSTHTVASESGSERSRDFGSIIAEAEIYRSKAEFVEMVERAKDYIRAGDIFQVVVGNRLRLNRSIAPLTLYRELRAANPSPYHFMFPWGNSTLVGASPESMMRCSRSSSMGSPEDAQWQITMRLVAGTYPRESNRESLEEVKSRFWNDEKERAEHIMLVDHVRNDIGRSSLIGSVEVRELLSVEPYQDVYHLVSEVGGILKPECTSLDALSSAFPIATLTGTPKIRAMEIIAELEGASRGFFGGALLTLGYDGQLDAAVCIRTAVVKPHEMLISTGAGIVYDSVAEREYEECLWKARSLLQATHALSQRMAA